MVMFGAIYYITPRLVGCEERFGVVHREPNEVWGERDDDRPLGIEPRFDACRVEQVPQRNAGGGKQDHRDGDLDRHKGLTQAARPARGSRGAEITERRSEIGTGGLYRGQQGEDGSAQDSSHQGEGQHPQVEGRSEHELQRPADSGREGKTDAAESVRITRRAIDAGINFIDTADVYSETRCEQVLGEVTGDAGVRDQIVLATKAGMRVGKAS